MLSQHVSTRRFHLAAASSLVLAALILTGCSTDETPEASAQEAFAHIHGLAFDPHDDQLAVATHEGIYKLDDDADTLTVSGPIGDLDIDAMGFTLVNGTAYASGHPGPNTPQSFGAPHLGLISSTDQGETWTTVSLAGAVDFHALAVDRYKPETIYGLSSSDSTVYRSDDAGNSWQKGAELTARDLAAPPNSSGNVYATTDAGLARSSDGGATFQLVPDAPALFLISNDGAQDGRLVGVDTDGVIWRQSAGEGGWVQEGTVEGNPQAMTVEPSTTRLVIADDRGIAVTEDYGRTWSILQPAL
ncbi:F510_1955 family glycosylhydrolase [Amnibacterium flavum]|uniref:Exo-alpha-sialidase n=1 Tax=Amnibacterium flavum TaxID=2173173 RepID=A0A2V1HPV5_9MICO|nr:hypothetical protein [Amnibacterium flavum]PVZ93159.1 hypothetical protein DDQ50_16680 [Amnibacterium flavum]